MKNLHDRFAKEYLAELLAPFGRVEPAKSIGGEVQEIDLYFEPQDDGHSELREAGIIGAIAQTACLIEPYRNPVGGEQIRDCVSKLLLVWADKRRVSRRQSQTLSPQVTPYLWILTPTCSPRWLEAFGAQPSTQAGFFELPSGLRTRIVILHQLAPTPETLWLRVLGRGTTQQQAVTELIALPESNPYRQNLMEILADWRQNLALRDNLNRAEQEAMMNLSPVYTQQIETWKREGIQLGKQEGIQLGKQEFLETSFRLRFGDGATAAIALIPQMIGLGMAELVPLAMNASLSELQQRFGSTSD